MRLITLIIDWSLSAVNQTCFYRTKLPLEADERILLELIKAHGEVDYEALGVQLGFGLISDPETNIFFDAAEAEIYAGLIQNLLDHRLIKKQEENLSLTKWGEEALDDDAKYEFHSSQVPILKLLNLKIDEEEDSAFPYSRFDLPKKEINFQSERIIRLQVKYLSQFDEGHDRIAKKKVEAYIPFFDGRNSILDHVQQPKKNEYRWEIKVPISIALVQINDTTDIEIFTDKGPLTELTSIIKQDKNAKVYDLLKGQLEYNLYLNKADKIEVSFLKKYKRQVDWQNILKDSRIVWEEELLKLLCSEDVSTGGIWTQVSSLCPLYILNSLLEEYQDFLYWFALTERFNVDFILETYTTFKWDTAILLERANSDQIQQLLSLGILEKEYAEWQLIYAKISEDFIEANLDILDFDLITLTREKFELSWKGALKYPDLGWDWRYISQNTKLDLLIQHLTQIGEKVEFRTIIERVLNECDANFIEIIKSNDLVDYIENIASKDERPYWINGVSQVKLDHLRLAFIEQYNLAIWGEGQFTGVEGNKNLIWDSSTFLLSQDKVKSNGGYAHVSRTITEKRLIDEYEGFNWDFNQLSRREDFLQDYNFIVGYKDSLSFFSVFELVPIPYIYEHHVFFHTWAREVDGTDAFWNTLYQRVGFRSMMNLIASTDLNDLNLQRFYNSYGYDNVTNFHLCPSRLSELPEYSVFIKRTTIDAPFDYLIEHLDLPWDKYYFTQHIVEEHDDISDDLIRRYEHLIDWAALIKLGGVKKSDLRYDKRLPDIIPYINNLPEHEKKKAWSAITEKIEEADLWESIEETFNNEKFYWDWTVISCSKKALHICSTENLRLYASKIDWEALSSNGYLHNSWKYSEDKFSNEEAWLGYIFSYLNAFDTYWDYKALSNADSINWNRKIISAFIDKWDWEVISLKSKIFVASRGSRQLLDYRALKDYNKQINWGALSKRHDLTIRRRTLSDYSEKTWDWCLLSSHPNLELSIHTLAEYRNKPWNWRALTRKKSLKLKKEYFIKGEYPWLKDQDWDWSYLSKADWVDGEILIELQEKDWDWSSISLRKDIAFDYELIKILLSKKNIHWDSVLSSKKLLVRKKTLKLLSKNVDITPDQWSHISSNPSLSFYKSAGEKPGKFKEDYFKRFINFWDWEMLIKHQKVYKDDLSFFNKYSEYINWDVVADYFDLTFDFIGTFGDKLDWYKISENTNLDFSIYYIKRYYNKWKWHLLLENTRVKENQEVLEYVENEVNSSPLLRLINRLYQKHSDFKGYVYHYTHLANALKILKEQKIKSRLKSEQFNNSAGTVWESNSRPWKYARFYFRPRTPNQHYNEGLGASDEKSYQRWAGMDFPKCPEPVIFKIDLYAFLEIGEEKLMLSNGNMQRRATRFGPLSKMVDIFNFDDVYHLGPINKDEGINRILNAREQELLIEEELCLANIPEKSISIIPKSANGMDTILSTPGLPNRLLNRLTTNSKFFSNRQTKLYSTKTGEDQDRYSFNTIDGFKYRVFCSKEIAEKSKFIHNGNVTRPSWSKDGHIAFEIQGGFELSMYVAATVTLFDEQPYKDENKQDWLIFTNDFEGWANTVSLLGKRYYMKTL